MMFPPSERKALLAVKGVGPTVVVRLEQMGFSSLAQLARANALDIVSRASGIGHYGLVMLEEQPPGPRRH